MHSVVITVVAARVGFVPQAMSHMHNVNLAFVTSFRAKMFDVIEPTFGRFTRWLGAFTVAVSELGALGGFLLALIFLLSGFSPTLGHLFGDRGISLPTIVVSHGGRLDGQTLQGLLRRCFVALQTFIHRLVPFETGHLPVATGIHHHLIVGDAMLESFAGLLFPHVDATRRAVVHLAQARVHFVRASGGLVATECVAEFVQIVELELLLLAISSDSSGDHQTLNDN